MPLETKDCALIVLASGLSERFGAENKLLVDLGGKPVATYVLDMAIEVCFGEVFVVAGVFEPSLSSMIDSYGFTYVQNSRPESGQGASLAVGAKRVLDENYKAACVMLADMPFVKENHIMRLLGDFDASEPLFSSHNGVMMPPAVLNHEALKQAVTLTGDRGLRGVSKGETSRALPLSDLAARDMDTPEDLAQMRELIET